MKTKILVYLMLGLLVVSPGIVFAQQAGHSVTIGTDMGVAGATVTVPMTWDTGTGTFVGLSYKVDFDPAVLTFVSCNLDATFISGFAFTICRLDPADAEGDLVELGLVTDFVSPFPVASGQVGTLTFTVANPAPFGPTPLVPESPEVGTGQPLPALNNGSVTVVGPRYASNPTGAAGVSMAGQQTSSVNAVVEIDNISVFDTTLTGAGVGCVISSDPSTKFSLSGDTMFSVADEGPNAFVTVACDSSAIGGPFAGEMSCTHDGDNMGADSSPVLYALTCDITEGPQPRYTGTPVNTDMTPSGPVEQGDPALAGSLTIDNSLGDPADALNPVGSILTGNGTGCTYSGATQISVANQGDFSLQQLGVPTQVLTWSCDTTTEGSYSGLLSCVHNGVNVASPQEYTLSCDVGPPGPAGYDPNPADLSTINLTPAGDVIEGSTPAPTADLVITNTPPGPTPNDDADLVLSSCAFSGDTEITATQPTSLTLAPFEAATVTFTCDTASATDSPFTGFYSCNYDGTSSASSTTHNVSCGVRVAESDVDESPNPNDPLTIIVPQGGTNTVSVFLIETIGEGADNASFDCSLGDDTFFTITSASSGDIGSGETIEIVVEGRDPRPDEISASTTLTCTWEDSTGENNSATWLMEIRVPAENIPTMSDWSRILMILSLLAVGGFVVRRRLTA